MKKKYIKPACRTYRIALNQMLAQSGDGEDSYNVNEAEEGDAGIWYESKHSNHSSDIWNAME